MRGIEGLSLASCPIFGRGPAVVCMLEQSVFVVLTEEKSVFACAP